MSESIFGKLLDLHCNSDDPHVAALAGEAAEEILRLRERVDDLPMPLNQALRILSEHHTREDDKAGFVVSWSPGDFALLDRSSGYIQAWRSVRYAIGEKTEPST